MRGGKNTITKENVRAACGRICHKNCSGSLIPRSLASGGLLRLANKLTKMGPSKFDLFGRLNRIKKIITTKAQSKQKHEN
jgi:hypothetical protein